MNKKLNLINCFLVIFVFYMLISSVYSIYNTVKVDEDNIVYEIINNDGDLPFVSSEIDGFLYSNADELFDKLIINSKDYYYTNNDDLLKSYLDMLNDGSIIVNDRDYYLNNYKDSYYYDHNNYDIYGVGDKTIIPMNYLSKENILSFDTLNLFGSEDDVKLLIDILNDNGFNVSYNKANILGSYDTNVKEFSLSFLKNNIILLLIVFLSIYLSYISKRSSVKKIYYLMGLYGFSTFKVFKFFFKEMLVSYFKAFILFTILLFVLTFLMSRYIFISLISFDLSVYLITILFILIIIFLSAIFKTIFYRVRRKYV